VDCPHCRQRILRKQRIGRTCSLCRRRFAFDPQTNPLKLHDLRVLRLAAALSDGGRYRYTPTQLAWRAGRRARLRRQPPVPGHGPTLPPPADSSGRGCLVAAALGTVVAEATAVVAASQRVPAAIVAALLGTGVVVALVVTIVRNTRGARAAEGSRRAFPHGPRDLFQPWLEIYRRPPPHLLWPPDWPAFTEPPPATAAAAVVCRDVEALACLAANAVPDRLGVALVSDAGLVPPHLPIVLLHDADASWCRYAAELRRARTARVVTAALRPSQVMAARNVPSRWAPRVPEADLDALDALEPLTADERTWLRLAWTPLLELSPRQLIRSVEQAALRLDTTGGLVRSVGFLGAGPP
jgi:hypothetical protein